jgi:hypothetical protein
MTALAVDISNLNKSFGKNKPLDIYLSLFFKNVKAYIRSGYL